VTAERFTGIDGCLRPLRPTRKPSWRWQTRATRKHAKIAPIRSVSFHFTEFHFAKFHITGAWRHAI